MIKYAAIKNNKTGKVHHGIDHTSILRYRDEECRLIITDLENITYGFITDNGVFLNREEAAAYQHSHRTMILVNSCIIM